MTQIRHVAAATVAAAALVAAAPAAQQHEGHDKWGTVGQNITITACVEKGQKDDTFLLTNVADVPVHPATMGKVVYWLDSIKEIRKHVGHQVRVNGKITEVEKSEMEVKAGDDKQGGWYVEIEGPGKDVRAPASKVGVETGGRKNEADDIKTTLVKLKVSDVTMVAASCPAR